MTEKFQKVRHLSDCQTSTEAIPERCAVIHSSPDLSLEKRKEEANQQIFLKRI